MKKSIKIFLVILISIFTAISLAGIYKFNFTNSDIYVKSSNGNIINIDDLKSKNKTLLGSDRDKNGCIPSAGYIWSKEKQKCVRPWEEKISEERKIINLEKDRYEIQELKIGPEMVDCVGAFQQKCLIVNGEFFYDQIENFDYQEGYTYQIKVKIIKTCNPEIFNDCLEDIGIYRYELVELLQKKLKN